MTPFGHLVEVEAKALGYTIVEESRNGEGDMIYRARGDRLPSMMFAVSGREIAVNQGKRANALASHRVYNGYRTANVVGGMA